jgi:hypothetical protein
MNLCSTSIATLGATETVDPLRKDRHLKMKRRSTRQITVLLAEDHAAYRESLKLLVEADGDNRYLDFGERVGRSV